MVHCETMQATWHQRVEMLLTLLLESSPLWRCPSPLGECNVIRAHEKALGSDYGDHDMDIVGGIEPELEGRDKVLWDPTYYEVDVMSMSDQVIHRSVNIKGTLTTSVVSVVYDNNVERDHRVLWNDLVRFSNSVSQPWIVGGDFNAVLSAFEKVGGNPIVRSEVEAFSIGLDAARLSVLCFSISEYLDEATLIPKNTSVLVRRVPGRPRMPIVTERDEYYLAPSIFPDLLCFFHILVYFDVEDGPKVVENGVEDAQPAKSSFLGADSSAMRFSDESEWDEFGNDLYSIPEVLPVHSSNPVLDAAPPNKADEDSKIKALIDTPALDWARQTPDGFGSGRGFGRGGMGGRMMGGRGFGRVGLERKTPPQGYICHRCKVPGHFIQHCPTNGDPNYDIKRVKPPTGIPKSMLMATPDGSYALSSGVVAVLKPNEAAFEKEIEGLPSTRSVSDLPPELYCPLCKEVMKDAVLTSKCCFKSYCDKCIRDHIISKSICVCGATNVLADDLLPNKTLRDTINRILESNNSSAENAGSMIQVQDMESARCPQPKIPSPTFSAASKGEKMPPPCNDEIPNVKETTVDGKAVVNPLQQSLEKGKTGKAADISEATFESMSVKEPTSQGSAPLADEEVQQKLVAGDPGKKKKKKKIRMPINAADMQWRASQDLAAENYMMPLAPSAYNPYWAGMQLGMDGYMAPYSGVMPYTGYPTGPFDIPFGGILPQDHFGGQGYMFPVVPPQRDLSEFGMGSNTSHPVMSREEFETRKADLKRKREIERRGDSFSSVKFQSYDFVELRCFMNVLRSKVDRERSKDRECGREVSSSGDVSSMKSKLKLISQAASSDHHHHHRHRSERALTPERSSRDVEPARPGKRKAEHHYHRDSLTVAAAEAEADRKQKASVFSRISFPEDGGGKKRKLSSSMETNNLPNGGYKDYKEYEPSAGSTHHRPPSNGYRDDWKPPVKAVSIPSSGGRKSMVDHDSSDDDRHFKRKPSRYEPPPLRDHERDYERDRGYSKHR
ncbi:hypothetical protein HHK36_028013 [Tetracentron sinense]|uniref:DWNN domain-containing protein n=1 Tax=Tetracentron sinense TaxID=13715 RepID=A0A834YE57_TETSI|nr:hypothetical protein HHK36_028013 [Tetracentron sinense]